MINNNFPFKIIQINSQEVKVIFNINNSNNKINTNNNIKLKKCKINKKTRTLEIQIYYKCSEMKISLRNFHKVCQQLN